MSLYGSIRLAANALQANQIALQVVGQNIANASTPGYIRVETVLTPAATQKMGNLSLGLGVRVEAVVQKIDKFLEERLRGAIAEQASAEAQENTFSHLEQLIGGLNDSNISTAMTSFFNSISDILNQPEDASVRNLAVLNAGTLAQEISRLSTEVRQERSDLNDQIRSMAGDINHLIEQIRTLNVRIAETEGGSISRSDAVGLRDQRLVALENLAKLVDIQVTEHDSGGVTVHVGGDFLVTDGISHPVEVTTSNDRGLEMAHLRLQGTDSPLDPPAGQLHGLLVSRDEVLGGFLGRLDDFAGTLAFEFNKVFSSGQGLHGYETATSTSYVTDAAKPLDQAGLRFTPVNGSFQILVHDTKNQTTHTADIQVHLLGDNSDTTLQNLADAISQVTPLRATVTSDGELTITSQSADHEFAFANDTSGVLAALGINTLFTGSTAGDLGINQAIASDPAKFAASMDGIGAGTENAVRLAAFPDQPIASHNDESITTVYDRLVAETTQDSMVAHALADGARAFEQTLDGEKLAMSGVNIDEEAIMMINLQKAFQASARYIATLTDMLDMLVSL